MSKWIKCDGLPLHQLTGFDRIDVCFYQDIIESCTVKGVEVRNVSNPNGVVWWRPAAAPSATLPAAENPREVSGMQPDDAEPSREPATVSHAQQRAKPLDAQEAFGLADEVKLVGKFENVNADEAASVPLTDSPAEKYFAVMDTLQERGARYGDFTWNAAISQDIKRAMSGCKGWSLLNDVQREALTMIAQKIARILNGDPNYRDNWHDIQGYARLAEERCRGKE